MSLSIYINTPHNLYSCIYIYIYIYIYILFFVGLFMIYVNNDAGEIV